MSEANSDLTELLECRCADIYSIEPCGPGHALYFGRCQHRHGYRVLQITECNRSDILKMIEKKLNDQAL